MPKKVFASGAVPRTGLSPRRPPLLLQCLNCQGLGGSTPQLFSQLPNTLSNYALEWTFVRGIEKDLQMQCSFYEELLMHMLCVCPWYAYGVCFVTYLCYWLHPVIK